MWPKVLFLFFLAVVLTRGEESCSAEQHGSEEGSCGCAQEAREEVSQLATVFRKVTLPEEVISKLGNVLDTKLLEIPGGSFTMGTDEIVNFQDGEGPPRKVIVSDFQLQEMEVSIIQFAKFVYETNYSTDAEKFGWSFAFLQTLSDATLEKVKNAVEAVPWWVPVEGASWLYPEGQDAPAFPDRLNHPVTHVSHNDAKAYCDWLGLRLPTEAEFEYAMRGGLENNSYPWGNDLVPEGKHRANLWQGEFPTLNTVEDGFRYSSPVDAFGPQNAFGLYNIVGNAWEWVADAWITQHERLDLSKPLVDPQIEIQGKVDAIDTERVKRGGSYMCHESYCLRYRTASRSSNSADSSAQNLGFRCAA